MVTPAAAACRVDIRSSCGGKNAIQSGGMDAAVFKSTPRQPEADELTSRT